MTTPIKQQKRTSLNHYMIESSITEEIREEDQSDKKSSDKTPQQSPLKDVDYIKMDHVIVKEGETSMFQHPASVAITDKGSSELGATAEESPQQSSSLDTNKHQISKN